MRRYKARPGLKEGDNHGRYETRSRLGGVALANFLFFSFQKRLSIDYMKISIKFDNEAKGNARFSFKMWLQKDPNKIPELYLLISNRENNVILERTDKDYNKYLMKEDFIKTAGIEDIEKLEESDRYALGKIMKFEEDKNLEDKRIIYPKMIEIEEINRKTLPDIPQHIVRNNDILLRIKPYVEEDIEGILGDERENSCIIEFQFRIFLRRFLDTETLKNWKSSSESWSTNVDIHKERGFEDIHGYFKDCLKYPKNLDLWINIPHGHLFIASSPVYQNAIKLKTEDIQYKTYKKNKDEKEFYRRFETKEGDYSVKISNSGGNPKEFSIVCVSPFLPEEAPRKLGKEIREFKRKSKEFVTWRGIIGPFALLIAAMSMVISATIALTLGGSLIYNNETIAILVESFFYALFIWALFEFINIIVLMLGKFDERLEKLVLNDRKWVFLIIVVILVLHLMNS